MARSITDLPDSALQLISQHVSCCFQRCALPRPRLHTHFSIQLSALHSCKVERQLSNAPCYGELYALCCRTCAAQEDHTVNIGLRRHLFCKVVMKLVYAAASTLPAGHLHVCTFVDVIKILGAGSQEGRASVDQQAVGTGAPRLKLRMASHIHWPHLPLRTR